MLVEPHLTHVARRVRDVDKTVDFYRRYVSLHVVHERTDNSVRVVWLSEEQENPSFVLVLIGIAPGECGEPSPADHLGYDLASRQAVDEIAVRGEAEGVLAEKPVYAGRIVGYFCVLRDPDGNFVEFSHGQPINPRQVSPKNTGS